MAATGVIGRAGTPLDIKLGQSPSIDDPATNVEVQQIYNALHLLSEYMAVLRENLESADGQIPSESIRFRRTFWGTAGQKIALGAVVCCFNNVIINGVSARSPATGSYDGSQTTLGDTGTRAQFGVTPLMFGIALTEAASGELVRIGIGPGVLQLPAAKCGQLVWGVDSRSIYSSRTANTANQVYSGRRDLVGNGGLYLANVTGGNTDFSGVRVNWEGYWLPGYPGHSGNQYTFNRVFLYPIGVCIADGFVMFSDYKRSDSPQRIVFP